MTTEFKRNRNGTCSISLKGMTQGKALALANALGGIESAVAEDIRISICNAVQQSNETGEAADKDQELFDAFSC